jgi:hypothetical protein
LRQSQPHLHVTIHIKQPVPKPSQPKPKPITKFKPIHEPKPTISERKPIELTITEPKPQLSFCNPEPNR